MSILDAFHSADDTRQKGGRPELADYVITGALQCAPIQNNVVRKIVNAVYFDPSFSHVEYGAFQLKAFKDCMAGRPITGYIPPPPSPPFKPPQMGVNYPIEFLY
jgi:hypothetical protein